MKECRAALLVTPYGEAQSDWSERVMERNLNDGVAVLTDKHGQTWLTDQDAELLGYTMSLGTIIDLGGKYYEVNGHRASKGWWIEQVIVDGAADDLTPEMFLGTET